LHEQFPFIDVVCSGEADVSFPAVVRALRQGTDLRSIRGIVYRENGRARSTGPADLVTDLDGLPPPDYEDFLAALGASPVGVDVTPQLLLETSRGCWWGEKNHCTFCGLNGGTMAFRSKSAERVIAEVTRLQERYGAGGISVVDNILDMRYFTTLLPLLERRHTRVNLFYEVKANLTRARVRQLADAGIAHIQPGIESLSDHVLELMRKGTTALQNIQLLKWCREYGIRPEWNFLYGFPGETAADYEAMLPLIDAIRFLDPPSAYGPIRLDRFSPYHDDPGSFGMTNVRPQAPYRYLYPEAPHLARIAYYFDFDYADGRVPVQYAEAALAHVQQWMDTGPQGGVWLVGAGHDGITLVRQAADGRRHSFAFRDWQADVYTGADSAHSLSRLTHLADPRASADEVRDFLASCVAQGLMVHTEDRYLSLAVHRPPLVAPPTASTAADATRLAGTPSA
jgi:ribosomal peptide maturation radical SAM protein 1